MKTFFKPLIFALLVIAAVKGFAQCNSPSFTYIVGNSGQVDFTDYGYSYDSLSNAPQYLWNFGDGDTSHSSNYDVTHTYASGGTYTVSLGIFNPTSGCDSTVSQTILVSRCHGAAQYTTQQIGFGDYSFTTYNWGLFPGATYLWDFGDGTTSTSSSVTHQYATTGNYAVSLIVTDASLSCIDTSYQDGMAANIAVNLCNYQPAITDTEVSFNPAVVNFHSPAAGGNGNYTYTWSFGDGGTGTGADISHTYNLSGYETVNLTVSDASGTGCSATANANVSVSFCGFTTQFSNYGNGLTQTFDAYTYDSITTTVSNYAWSFTGATPANGVGQQVNNIVYPAIGNYNVCLYLTSTTGCYDSICHSIYVSPPVFSISGAASKSGGSGFVGMVYLIVQDSVGHLSLIDSTVSLDDSAGAFNYGFYNLPADTYYVKAALGQGDADYANYIPTYYGDVLTWGTATPVIIINNSVTGVDIALVEGTNPGGPGFVGGYVSQGAGLIIGNAGGANAKALGDPIGGVQINLLTSTNAAVAYTFTDVNGHYQFANLAVGSYKIYVESLNKIPTPLEFTLTNENPVDSGANMSVNSHGTTGIDNVNGLQIMEVYPNPVISALQLQIGCKQDADATLKVVDVLGRTNLTESMKLTSGQNTVEINMESLAAGVYQLVLQTGSSQVAYKIVKAK